MTTNIKNWSSTPGDNNSTPPNGAPEGMAPSSVNDVIRQNMAEVRKWYEDKDWVDFGLAGLTYVNANEFRLTNDQTAIFNVGRRVRAIGSTPFTIYGTITASVFSTNTTVTVSWDSGSLDNTLSEVAVGAEINGKAITANGISFPDDSVPASAVSGSAVPTGVGMDFWGAEASLPSGWVFAFGTIGNASSNATSRANDDTQTLFELLWNSTSNTEFPILDSAGSTTTRGASAAADFAANKQLPLPDKRGRASVGKDDMGGTAANRLTGQDGGVDGSTLGAAGGDETHQLTEAQLAEHDHQASTNSYLFGSEPGSQYLYLVNNNPFPPGDQGEQNTGNAGQGEAHNNVQPSIVCNYIIKL